MIRVPIPATLYDYIERVYGSDIANDWYVRLSTIYPK